MAISRDKKPMRALLPLLFALLISGCAALEGKPQPAPPATETPQEINRWMTAYSPAVGMVAPCFIDRSEVLILRTFTLLCVH